MRSRSSWILEVSMFLRSGESRSTQRKTSRRKGENQQQTQTTYGVNAGIWARTTAPPLFPNVSVNSKSNLKQKKNLAPPKVHLGWVIGQEVLENFRFWDEGNYKYEIFSILSIAHAWTSVILAGKRDSRRHSSQGFSENVVLTGTSFQM